MPLTQQQPAPLSNAADMNDLARYASVASIEKLHHDSRTLVIDWNQGGSTHFPAPWLRENCPCPHCRHPQTMERLYMMLDEPAMPRILDAVIAPEGGLLLRFGGHGIREHTSRFDAGWLHHWGHLSAVSGGAGTRTLWDASVAGGIPRFPYEKVMHSDAGLAAWLTCLTDFGVSIVDGIPARLGEVRRIAERVGPLRDTNFGETFDVESKPNPNNAAYTAMGLEPHTDLPNMAHPPDVQLLLCITHDAIGGGSILVDGFRVAEEFRALDPAGFEILSTQAVEFRFHDTDVDLRHRAPVIALDSDRNIIEIRFSNWLRSSTLFGAELAQPYYEALLGFWRLLRDARFQLRPRLRSGEMVAFDNRRVLHGRDAFDPNTGVRLLQGCYLDRDTIDSRLQVIARHPGASHVNEASD